MKQSIKPWIGLAALAVIIIGTAGWFLLISPTRAETADTRASIESEQDRTIMLTSALEVLKAEYAEIDTYRGELDAVTAQVPTTAETAEYRRTLERRAEKAGITIVSVTTGVSAAAPAAEEPAAPAEETTDEGASDEESDESSDEATDEASEPAAASAVPTTSGRSLVAIPLEITIVGTYDAARDFIAQLQKDDGRLFLLQGFGAVSQLDAPETGGRPQTSKGDVEMAIQGSLLVLTPQVVTPAEGDAAAPTDGAAEEPTEEAPAEQAPLPSSERNPFAPIA